MNRHGTYLEADVVIAGSGPGGATVARQLARAGQRVILLERGRDHRGKFYYGTYLGAVLYTDRASLLFTREGLNIIRPLMTGGATSMYCGSAAKPPAWFKTDYGIDLDAYAQETIDELNIAPLPEALRGKASTRIAEAAASVGLDWQPQPKFMSPARSPNFDCGAHCMLGCRCRAKWSANEYIDQAVAAGSRLITQAKVERVLVEGGSATGVQGTLAGKPFQVRADVVVLAAGGIGSPLILQNSGPSASPSASSGGTSGHRFAEAGVGLAMDSTVMVYGASEFEGIGHEPPMTYGFEDLEHGYMLSTLIDPWLLYPLITALKGPRYPLTWPRWNRTLGVMIKVTDEVAGGIAGEHDISKPITERDQARFDHAIEVSRQILVRAGCAPDTIFVTPVRGTHPSATVRIGEMLDQDLQTQVRYLYVCDASTFPRALGRPTVLTIISLAKRLSEHLLTNVFEETTGRLVHDSLDLITP
jgi:choline dehydrogenase-like flavoprotein